MKTLFQTCCALAMLALAGCVTPPTQQEYEATVATIGYGAELPADWQERVKTFMEMRLKDPVSAIWKFDEKSATAWAGESDMNGVRVVAGHVVTGQVNAKNSYGGYTGFEQYQFMIRDGEVIAYQSKGIWHQVKPHFVREAR